MKTPKPTCMAGQVNIKHGSSTVTESKQGNDEAKSVFYHYALRQLVSSQAIQTQKIQLGPFHILYFVYIRETPARDPE